jgi:hypothetical protein
MANIDLEQMLDKVKASQWALKDIDWDAPGAELITDEQWPDLRDFMVDLVWIEHVGARGFAAMAKNAPTDTLRQMYHYFYAEEQRHANAEMALMKRWGMLEGDDVPEPNNNIRLVVDWMEKNADELPCHTLGTVIPALEVALDGALCQFLLDTVDDPVCHEAFARINEDESRHLSVGFSVMETQGHNVAGIAMVRFMGRMLRPSTLLGLGVYFPLLNKMRDNVVKVGLPEEKLYAAMEKFEKIGGRTSQARRNPMFRFIAKHSRIMVDRNNKLYHTPVDLMVRITDLIPAWALPDKPGWVGDVTWNPRD